MAWPITSATSTADMDAGTDSPASARAAIKTAVDDVNSMKAEYGTLFSAQATAAGTDTYTASLSPAISGYVSGADYRITFTNANTSTTPTLNLNSLGAKTIVKEGSTALVAGDIPAGHTAVLRYNGTNMVLMNPAYPSNVKLSAIKRTEGSSENAGIVTVTSSLTTVTTVDLGTVNSGDRILAQAYIVGSKTSAGDVLASIAKSSGTATIAVHNDATELKSERSVAAADAIAFTVSGIIKVTGSGTLVLKLESSSASSDLSVSAGAGQMYALVLNNG